LRLKNARSPLKESLEQWIKGMRNQKKSTVAAYRSTTRRILRWAESKSIVPLGEFTPAARSVAERMVVRGREEQE
jgi:hypothetical protein